MIELMFKIFLAAFSFGGVGIVLCILFDILVSK